MAGFCTNKYTWSTPEGGAIQNSCGRCDACRQQQMTETVGRCLLEDEAAPYGTTFLTFTYADTKEFGATEVIEECDRGYAQVQLMFKKLRKMQKAKFRYIVAMEHGSETNRRHFHALIFWYTPPPDLEHNHEQKRMWRHWPHGYTHLLPIDDKTATFGYLVKYMLKAQPKEEFGKPKTSGSKRSSRTYDPLDRVKERYTRLDRALAAGYDSYSELKLWEKQSSEKTVWWSKVPTLGAGHKDLPDDANPLAIMARRLVDKGLPLTLNWKHPHGFYQKGGSTVMVKYYMTNKSFIAEYYRHYCREYYLKHGRGDPPISTHENSKGNNERETVLWAAYGRRTTVLPATAPELAANTKEKLLAIAPLRTDQRNSARYKKEFPDGVKTFSSAPGMYFFKDRHGRVIAVKETETLTTTYLGAYASDKYEIPKTKGFQRWPVATKTELLRLARGLATDTPLPKDP